MEKLAAIFIDGGYLDKVLQHEHAGTKVDYDRLATAMANGADRYRAYYYYCRRWVPEHPTDEQRRAQADQDRFFERVKKFSRFEVRLGQLKFRGKDAEGRPIFQQKGVDVLLAIDVVRISMNRSASIIAILAGDGDYLPLIQVAKDAGLVTRLYHAQGSTSLTRSSPELWNACDERIALDAAFIGKIKRVY